MNELLTLTGAETAAITATDQARRRRDALLDKIHGEPLAVKDAVGANYAAELLKEIKNFTGVIEAARVDVKTPVIALGRNIDALAKELTEQLDAEAKKISSILGVWQAEQNRIAEAARRAAREKEAQLAREVAEQERKAIEAENARVAELQAKADRARTDVGRAKAEAQIKVEQERAAEAAQARSDAVTAQIIDIRTAATTQAPAKPAGVATREEVMIEVEDIAELYRAMPSMVKLEANVQALKAVIRGNPKIAIPGVRHWKEAKAVVR